MLWLLPLMLLTPPVPPTQISDLNRFPQLEDCEIQIKIAQQRLEYLKTRWAMETAGGWEELSDEIGVQEAYTQLWRNMWLAQYYRKYACHSECMETIQRIRDTIGEDAYAAGELPMVRLTKIPRNH